MFEPKKFSDIFNQMRAHAGGVLTDFEPGSVSRTLTEAFSYEMALLYEKMQLVYLSGFVDSAQATHLDNVVAVLGIKRGLPDFAEGAVTFTRDPGSNDILVPAGTLVATEESLNSPKKVYQTVEEMTMTKDQTTLDARIQALERGEEQETPAETIVVLPRPVPGIKSAINASPVRLSGKRRETDDELRRRAKNTLLAAGKATTFAIENALLSLPKVTAVKVLDHTLDPANIDYGIVDIYVDHPDFTNDTTQGIGKTIRETVDKVRAAGIFPRIQAPVRALVDAVFKITKTPNLNLNALETAAFEDKIAQKVQEYFDSLKVDDPLSVSKLVKQLLLTENVDGLSNYQLKIQGPGVAAPDTYTFADTNDIAAPTRGRFRVNTIRVASEIKTLRVAVQFLLPNNVAWDDRPPKTIAGPAEATDTVTRDKAAVINEDIALMPPPAGADVTLSWEPWDKPGEIKSGDTLQLSFVEKAELVFWPFSKYLDIDGAFSLQFLQPLTEKEKINDRAKIAANLNDFFRYLLPGEQLILFEQIIQVAKKGVAHNVLIKYDANDFSTDASDNRVNSKGIQLKMGEKAKFIPNIIIPSDIK